MVIRFLREFGIEIAAPRRVGPQHAPSRGIGSPRVRMEARRTDTQGVETGGRHVGP